MKILANLLFFLIILSSAIILISNTSALGIASDFLGNNTMELKKGESRLYGVRLQNPKLDFKKARFVLQSDFAKVIDYQEIYEFSEEQKIISILINVTAPKNAHKGQEFIVSYYVEPVEVSGQGLTIKPTIEKAFKVKILEKRWFSFVYSYSYIHLIIFIYGILILLVVYLLRKKPKAKLKLKRKRR